MAPAMEWIATLRKTKCLKDMFAARFGTTGASAAETPQGYHNRGHPPPRPTVRSSTPSIVMLLCRRELLR